MGKKPLGVAFALFVLLRLGVAGGVFLMAGGAEVSSDARFYLYLSEHPLAVMTGENLAARGGDVAVLSNYGPFLGPVVGGPLALARYVLPEYFAVRAAFIFWEAVGLAAAFLAASGLARARKTFGPGRSGTRFLMLAAVLPLAWVSTAAWPQDEIILAPFVFLAFTAAIADRPAAAAWAIGLGALCSKYYALAFIPAAWLTCPRRGRFLRWAALATLPVAAWAGYLRWVYGVTPLVGYDVEVSLPFTISLFSIFEYARSWFGVGTPAGWLGVATKVTLIAALAAVTVKFYRERRPAGAADARSALRVWGAFGAVFLLVNAMGQPEYLAWFAYLVPFALVALWRGRRLAAAAGGVVALVFAGWVWNVASAVVNWGGRGGDGVRSAFAGDVTALLGAGGAAALEVVAAVLYLAGLAYVAVACLRRPGASARAAPAGLEVRSHYSTP